MPKLSRPLTLIDTNDYTCGIGSWRPKWIQRFATPKMFILIFGIVGVIQGAVFTYIIASLTTLEKRYSFGSRVSGLILIADDIIELILSPILGYIAIRLHRPRLIGICQMIVAVGCYLAAVPYFIYGPGLKHIDSHNNNNNNNKTFEFCESDRDINSGCDDNVSNTVIPAVIILCLTGCCAGIGSMSFYTIGIPFIDDNVKKKNSALYISTSGALRLCGPTLAFMLSSFCLRFYENPLIDPGINDPKDPRWIGAWWIGFLVLGTGIFIFSMPLFLFPRNFKTADIYINKPYLNDDQKSDQSHSDFWLSTLRVLKNPIFVCYTLGTSLRLFGALGYMTFKSKYIESEYKKSASTANFFSGIIGIVPSAIGIFLGGLFITRFKPGPKLLTSLIAIVEVFGFIGLFSAMFLGCPASQFQGYQESGKFHTQDMCNDNCQCTHKVFQPMCDPNGKTNYFSPCFGGCKKESLKEIISNSGAKNAFSNCNCFSGSATEGYCQTDCGNNFGTYITILGISNIIGNLAKTGNSIIAMRIVDKKDKTFSLGLAGGFMCIFTWIPYPLVFGAITDSACLVWEEDCGQTGNCWIYDSNKFRQYLHGSALFLLVMGSVFDVIVILLSSRIKNLYTDDIETDYESKISLRLNTLPDRRNTLEIQ